MNSSIGDATVVAKGIGTGEAMSGDGLFATARGLAQRVRCHVLVSDDRQLDMITALWAVERGFRLPTVGTALLPACVKASAEPTKRGTKQEDNDDEQNDNDEEEKLCQSQTQNRRKEIH